MRVVLERMDGRVARERRHYFLWSTALEQLRAGIVVVCFDCLLVVAYISLLRWSREVKETRYLKLFNLLVNFSQREREREKRSEAMLSDTHSSLTRGTCPSSAAIAMFINSDWDIFEVIHSDEILNIHRSLRHRA